MDENLYEKIYKLVYKIPAGRVTTYGSIARKLGLKDSRKVGWALSKSQDRALPWYRVVNKQGKLFGKGQLYDIQKSLLLAEGITFKNKNEVNMTEFFINIG